MTYPPSILFQDEYWSFDRIGGTREPIYYRIVKGERRHCIVVTLTPTEERLASH